METEYLTARKLVCQDFQILMRTEVKIPIPEGYPVIRAFYESVIDTILRWTTEREGERLREKYLAAEMRQRAKYRTEVFRVWGEVLPVEQGWFAILCRAKQSGEPEPGSTDCLQVWNLSEQTLLPPKETILRFPENGFENYFTNFCKKWKKHLKKKKGYVIINK